MAARGSDSHEEGEIDDEEQEEVYCVCRRADTHKFMICCDQCEEWYHGDCISITAEYAKKVQTFFCLQCREKNPALEIVLKEKKQPKKRVEPKPVIEPEPVAEKARVDPDYQPQRANKSKYVESDDDYEEYDEEYAASRRNAAKAGRATKEKKARTTSTKRGSKKTQSARTAANRQVESKARRGHRRAAKEEKDASEGPRQCYGPGCTEVARKGSKYCGDECGLRLATNRIYEILPNRIQQWQSTPSVADEFSQKALDKIRQEQHDARHILELLNKKQEALNQVIEDGKKAEPLDSDEEAELEEKAEAENELSIYCVSCGHEVSYRFAMRHMERCFNKFEAQTSYATLFKTQIDDLFCDYYNPSQKTYCKRLRILCPEHSKDAKIGDDEVCGAPLHANVFEETKEFCRVLKKTCFKHYCWEKLRRAEIDMEKVQQWLRIDDLYEREQKMRFTMANRGGVLGLMLHQTLAADST